MPNVYSLAELQQARDAHRNAQALPESLRPSASTATKEKRNNDALIFLLLLERNLNPECIPPDRQSRFRGPPEVRAALEDLRDACYLLADCWGRSELWKGESAPVPPLTMPDPPADIVSAIADAVARLGSADRVSR